MSWVGFDQPMHPISFKFLINYGMFLVMDFKILILILFWLIFFISIIGKKFPNKWARAHESVHGKPPNTLWEIFGKLVFLFGIVSTVMYLIILAL